MYRFIRAENVQRYVHLLDHVTDEPVRQRILQLLAEEQQKQKAAGDDRPRLSSLSCPRPS